MSDNGSLLGSGTFILQPRSFVIIGSLDELTGDQDGPVPDKVRSFELFRRNLQEPEVITYDELLMRAEWHVEVAAAEASANPEGGASDGVTHASSKTDWTSELEGF